MSTWLSPDCATAGKCRACDGAAFDHDNDEITDYECRCHEGGSENG